jgi:hypothetical protein
LGYLLNKRLHWPQPVGKVDIRCEQSMDLPDHQCEKSGLCRNTDVCNLINHVVEKTWGHYYVQKLICLHFLHWKSSVYITHWHFFLPFDCMAFYWYTLYYPYSVLQSLKSVEMVENFNTLMCYAKLKCIWEIILCATYCSLELFSMYVYSRMTYRKSVFSRGSQNTWFSSRLMEFLLAVFNFHDPTFCL